MIYDSIELFPRQQDAITFILCRLVGREKNITFAYDGINVVKILISMQDWMRWNWHSIPHKEKLLH